MLIIAKNNSDKKNKSGCYGEVYKGPVFEGCTAFYFKKYFHIFLLNLCSSLYEL